MDARGRFGEHERVARGVSESNSSFLSAFQTFQVHPSVPDPDLEIRKREGGVGGGGGCCGHSDPYKRGCGLQTKICP